MLSFLLLQAMASSTEHLLAHVWGQGGVRDVYADFNELTLNITTNALFGVDMSSAQAAGISGKPRDLNHSSRTSRGTDQSTYLCIATV